MRFDKLTIKTQEAVAEAMDLASDGSHSEVTLLHLLRALLGQEQGAVPAILQRIGVNGGQLAQQLGRALEQLPTITSGDVQPRLGSAGESALQAGWKAARKLKDEYLSTEHVLLGIIAQKGDKAAQFLTGLGVTSETVLQALQEIRGRNRVTTERAQQRYQA